MRSLTVPEMLEVDLAVPGKRAEVAVDGEAVVHALSCTDTWVDSILKQAQGGAPMVHVFENHSGEVFAAVGQFVAPVKLVTERTFVQVHATSGAEREDRPGA